MCDKHAANQNERNSQKNKSEHSHFLNRVDLQQSLYYYSNKVSRVAYMTMRRCSNPYHASWTAIDQCRYLARNSSSENLNLLLRRHLQRGLTLGLSMKAWRYELSLRAWIF